MESLDVVIGCSPRMKSLNIVFGRSRWMDSLDGVVGWRCLDVVVVA